VTWEAEPVRIRAAQPPDAAQIAAAHVRTWQSAYRGHLPQDLLDSMYPAQRVPRWQATLEQADWPRKGTLVAEDGEAIVGFADLRPARDHDRDPGSVGEITSFYVVPDRWGNGIGRQLMNAGVTALTRAGYLLATLWVLDTNVRAIRFYEAMGWRADGGVKDDEVAGMRIRDLRYQRDLAATVATRDRADC
jgi:ribosomal protein S18 acetylase RimI-like enzyme